MPRGVKKALKRGLNNAKKQLGPVVKAIAREAVSAAKAEAKAQGLGLLKRGVNYSKKNIFGNGDYRTNGLIHGMPNAQPSFGSTSSTFRRREPLGAVVSSATTGNFDIQKFRVNCGIATTFPWLSGFANNYESWKPLSVIFEYVPTSGMSVASGDTALGSVTMSAQYNPFATDPQNLQQIQGYTNSVTCAPYEHALCGIECKPSKRQSDTLLIRNANVSANGGLVLDSGYDTLFDLCEFFIATEGCQAASVKLGQIWVTYEIQLLNPIVPLVQAFNPGLSLISPGGTTHPSTDLFIATAAIVPQQWSITPLAYRLGTAATASANRIYLPNIIPGDYWLQCKYIYTAVTTTTGFGMTVSSGIIQTAGTDISFPQGGATSIANFCWIIPFEVVTSNSSTYITLSGLPVGNIDRLQIDIIRTPGSISVIGF
jgi:hypothetical protein